VLPGLVAGTAPRQALDLSAGNYFGGRKPDDGRIDWRQDAQRIHDLVRAVAPPYPGATTTIAGRAARILRTRVLEPHGPEQAPALALAQDACIATCGGGGRLRILAVEIEGVAVPPAALAAHLGSALLTLPAG
jgi:methionyl-tRNA formyltransferase